MNTTKDKKIEYKISALKERLDIHEKVCETSQTNMVGMPKDFEVRTQTTTLPSRKVRREFLIKEKNDTIHILLSDYAYIREGYDKRLMIATNEIEFLVEKVLSLQEQLETSRQLREIERNDFKTLEGLWEEVCRKRDMYKQELDATKEAYKQATDDDLDYENRLKNLNKQIKRLKNIINNTYKGDV